MALPDCEVDVVVVGSGAAGLTAALVAADGGLTVEVLEKSDAIGGATAFSGGGVWVPLTPHGTEVGVEDSLDEATAYVRACSRGGEPSSELLDVYVDQARVAFGFLETSTPVRFRASEVFSDYFPHLPGAKPRGRTLDPVPFESKDRLGEWDSRIRCGPHYPRLTLDEMAGAGREGQQRNGGASAVGFDPEMLEVGAERERAGVRTLGGGLVAALLRGALDRGVVVRTGVRARDLVVEAGRVSGVVAETDGESLTIGARRGVVLAAGGFEWNPEMVRTFLGVPELKPLSPPLAEGDGLAMGLAAGAAVANMTVAWSFPSTWDGHSTYDGKPRHTVATPRNEPGCITVNRLGRRFTNEGVCYMDFALAHRVFDPITQTYPNGSPVFAIFDDDTRQRIEIGDLRPGQPTPSWVHEAPSLAGLAEAVGIDPVGLCEEVERFNGFVAAGCDEDFGRGTVWFEGFTAGGPRPERSLAPIARPPYYALAIYDGALGTAGGVRIDRHARVESHRGEVIEGLYAAGNTAASIFGPGYPAGGATLGPAITFGYLAGRHLSGSPTTDGEPERHMS